MSMIGSIRDFIEKNCPLVENGEILVNYLSEEAVEYAIEEVPMNPILTNYIDGSSLRQLVFIFASRNFYSEDIKTNLKSSEFYEKFADWLEDMNKKRKFPNLGENKTVKRILATTRRLCS